MKSIFTPLYLSLFLHILTILVAGQSPPIYSPVDDITLACGNSGQQSTNFDNRTWIGDISSKYSPKDGKSNTTSQIRTAPPSSSASQPPYTTSRLSYSEFTYKIPLSSPGQKFIRLHFNPATYNPDFHRSNSLFSVKAAGFTLLSDFNASVTADVYGGPPLIREFCVNVETEQSLNITFTPAKDAYAFINGIEIVSMPTSLYYTSSTQLIGSGSPFLVGNNTALEMVYRINIGGSPILPKGDTGMYRSWDASDDTYLDDASRKFSVLPQNNTIELNFVRIPEYSAPKEVYVTGRSMGMNKTINKSYNLTWVFPLDPKFYYLVRLHFCEFESDITNLGDRSFKIYLANQTAEELADVIGWSGGNGNPVYRDYVVGMFMPPVGSRKKVDLFLVLAALQKDSYTSYIDAILNGLEIFKLSDSNSNLAGPNPDTPIYIAYDGINLNCGFLGSRSYDNRMWIGDINSTRSIVEEQLAGSQVRNAPPSSSNSSRLQVPYTTARISRFEFTYRFPLTAGQKFIRLHFNPASYGEFESSDALFFVTAGGYTLLNNFNSSLVANAEMTETIYKEFCMNIETNNTLDLTFSPSRASNSAYAFINGIEIVSMPTNLYYSSAESPGIKDMGKNVTYHIENNTALEMVYRLNIGGNTLSSGRDIGMYRKWDDSDDLYMDVLSRRFSVVIQSNTRTQLKFVNIPNYTAPGEIYQTGRSAGTKETSHKSYNLTWAFPVDPKFSYLVRLHFCEIDPDITLRGDRVFLVYIANQTAEEGADIIMWSGGNGIPIYRDYVTVMSDPGGPEKVSLFVSLQAKPKNGQTSYTDGILNGLEIFKLFDSKNSQISKTSSKSTLMIAIVGGVLSSILVCFVLGFLVIKRPWKSKDSGSRDRTTKSNMTPGSPLPSYFCRYFSLAEIKAATKNFNDTFIIGVGGFGNVYRGCIDGEATPVAIKRLKRESSQGAHEFKTEIEILSQLRHRHLVSLIGYCADKGEMILVYDYMSHGTLRDHLYHTNNPPLSWEQRLQICIGTAQGLQYLHSGAKGTIIHRDVKSTNILLDDKWVAKVSDFGLSKGTNNISKTHISTVVKGSFGYLDPEYYRRQRLTEKSDVYSLGVVLFEVLCARPAVIQTEELKQVSLAEWAKSCHQNGELDQIIDPSLRGKIAAVCLNKFTELAISCMDDNGMDRPSMNDVVKGLELALQLQKSAEGNSSCTEKNVETETGSSEQSCATIDSIKCISATIFSEINNPSGR